MACGGCGKNCEGNTTNYCGASCFGMCYNTCSGGCTGSCSVDCSGTCQGTCETSCTGGCGDNCTGGCVESCTSGCTGGCKGCSGCGTGCVGGCSSAATYKILAKQFNDIATQKNVNASVSVGGTINASNYKKLYSSGTTAGTTIIKKHASNMAGFTITLP